MFKLYLKIAWRNLARNKTYSLINMIGLATGLACFLMICMYVADELSYDRHNKDAERIYRINSLIRIGGSELNLTVASDPMGAALKKDYPQVEQYTRIYNSGGAKLVKKGAQYVTETRVAHVDSTFFEVFTCKPIHGDLTTALNEPNTAVITRTAAEKYFGTADAAGKVLETGNDNPVLYKVTAVIEDMPRNAHFNFDVLCSMDNVDYNFNNYLSHNFQTYLKLRPGATANEFEKIFPQYINKYVMPQAQAVMQIKNIDEFQSGGNRLEYSLTPLLDIHLRSDRFPELGTNGNIQYVYIFSAVALFILVIACINFVNLATARSMKRAREVGVRKVLGTTKSNLIRQFIFESALTVLISMIIALAIVWVATPFFNDVAAKELTIATFFNSKMLLIVLALPVAVSLLAGSYPAFFLSSFKPTDVLKGKANAGSTKSILRSGLVVFQFATSIMLIVATITVYQQLNFIQNKKIGFNKDQVLIIEETGYLGNNNKAFKNEMKKVPGVINGAFTGFLPVSGSARNDMTFSKDPVITPTNALNMQAWSIDYDYIPTLGMEVIKGRNFSPSFGTDSTALIINETTASLLGLDDPVGKKVYRSESYPSEKLITYTIVGVVRNFNFESMRQTIAPLCFILGDAGWSTAFRIDPEKTSGILREAERKWKSMSPEMPFSYRFLDDSFNRMYQAEQRVGKVAVAFATLAILIACLGLFGLATYMAEQRTKEIGVRKVLGATVNNIVLMLSRDFLKLVIIAGVIAFPLAWWGMHRWLQDFAFRIDMAWWVFIVSGILAAAIALFTISFQALKAALANPVNSLRSE